MLRKISLNLISTAPLNSADGSMNTKESRYILGCISMLNVVGASGVINATKSRCVTDDERHTQEWTDVMIEIVI